MMRRTFDAARANFLVNHPSVRPFIGGDVSQPLDMTEHIANRDNVFVDSAHGGFCFVWSAPRTYEVHTFILPEGRGAAALEFALLAREWMAEHFADHLWTMVKPEAGNVRAFTLKAGFKPAGSRTVKLATGPETYDLFDWRKPCQQR